MRNRRAAFTAFNTDLQVLHQWDCSKAQESRELPGIGADLEPGTAERLTVAMSWFGCSLVDVSTRKVCISQCNIRWMGEAVVQKAQTDVSNTTKVVLKLGEGEVLHEKHPPEKHEFSTPQENNSIIC